PAAEGVESDVDRGPGDTVALIEGVDVHRCQLGDDRACDPGVAPQEVQGEHPTLGVTDDPHPARVGPVLLAEPGDRLAHPGPARFVTPRGTAVAGVREGADTHDTARVGEPAQRVPATLAELVGR